MKHNELKSSIILILTGSLLIIMMGCSPAKLVPPDNVKHHTELVTEEDLEGLPAPVQKYLRYTQIIGKPKINTVRLRQIGEFRTSPDGKWMPYSAAEVYSVDPPSFVWEAKIYPIPFAWIKARDTYIEGKGNMRIKLMSLVKIIDASGPEMDQGAMVRFFNEIFWFPSAYLSDYIQWEAIDSLTARGTMRYGDVTASAMFYFNADGQLVNFIAERYHDQSAQYETWATPLGEYKEFHGIRIPVTGEGVWELDSGDFNYIRPQITDIEYNP